MSTIHDALQRLSQAHGSAALAQAFHAIQRSVRALRSAQKRKWGALASTFAEAMNLRDRMRADGATPDELDRHMESALRGVWPEVRTWQYYCEDCSDTGWEFRTCVNGSCGRPFALPKQASDDYTGRGKCAPGHTYARPCWCAKGQERKRSLMREPVGDEDAIAVAARTSKPTRVGR